MDLMILDQDFKAISIVDNYESVIWTDRYDNPGEFEIYTPVNDHILENCKVNNYVRIVESEHMMIIENLTIEANAEDGNHIKIIGRSLESILDRRVVIGEITLTGSLQNSIRGLINTNIVSPSDSARQIPNFIFEDSADPEITSLTYEGDFKGDSLLDIIQVMCQSKDIGFKVVLNDENQFVFSLYKGTDRSYKQETLPYVVFKPSFENIINSNYSETHSGSKTFCYIHSSYTERSEGSSSSETIDVNRTLGSGSGLLRKEIYDDASVTMEEGMSIQEFYAKMDEKGSETLKNHRVEKTFDGECETTRMFIYDRDFFMGDIVQVANEYGMEDAARVTEFIWSQSSSELKNYPTFKALDYEESEGS